jgi:hypothetical protein
MNSTNSLRSPRTFAEWQAFSRTVHAIANRITNSIHEKGWQIAESVGISRNMCCVHNASIDDELKGWCAGNPARLKAAKRANHLLNDWRASRLADRISARAFDRVNSR